MLSYSLLFLILAIIAGALGFSGVAGAATSIAQILFVLFLAVWIISLIASAFRKNRSMSRIFPYNQFFTNNKSAIEHH